MGYEIRYAAGPDSVRKRSETSWILPLISVFFSIFCVITASFFPDQWDVAKNYLIPGDPDVTIAACKVFGEQITAGEPLDDAVVTFCREILYGNTVPD